MALGASSCLTIGLAQPVHLALLVTAADGVALVVVALAAGQGQGQLGLALASEFRRAGLRPGGG